MEKIMGHAGYHRRVAINVGAGFLPGMNSVLMGAARAAWDVMMMRFIWSRCRKRSGSTSLPVSPNGKNSA